MIKRVLTHSLGGVGACLYPMLCGALGLGELQVESSLNQPLRARIEIVDVSDEDWHQIQAHIASQDSSSDGLGNPRLLGSITLHAMEEVDHRHFIEVRSTDVFTEPLFELPIQVGGQTLQVVRTYWVMLDPPVDAPTGAPAKAVVAQVQAAKPDANVPAGQANARESRVAATPEANAPAADHASERGSSQASAQGVKSADVQAAPQAAQANARVSRTASAPAGLASARGSRGAASAQANTRGASVHASRDLSVAQPDSKATYTVSRSDTLERIARRLGARNAADRSELMDWIFQHNPKAFYGDIHHLHAGVQLVLPEGVSAAGVAQSARAASAAPSTLASGANAAPVQANTTESSAKGKTQQQVAQQPQSVQQAQSAQQQQAAEVRQRVASQPQAAEPQQPATGQLHSTELQQQLAAGQPQSTEPQQQVAGQKQAPGEQEKELEGQLETLQQMLTKMQQTIASQDAEIASLTRKITARPQVAAVQADNNSSAAVDDEDEAPPSRVRRALYYWIAGVVAVGVILVAVFVRLAWKRRSDSKPAPRYEAPREVSPQVSFADLPLKRHKTFDRPSPPPLAARTLPKPAEDRKTAASEDDPNASTGTDLWRKQSALLIADLPADVGDTDVLPFVLPRDGDGGTAEIDTNPPHHQFRSSQGSEAIERSATNMEIVKILENSLHVEPNRIDIQIKLLEIYHHEALGNRDNFHSLLHKLAGDRHMLSPAQRLYVEKLLQTLQESKPGASSSPIAEEAI
jgi:hypothetical protein